MNQWLWIMGCTGFFGIELVERILKRNPDYGNQGRPTTGMFHVKPFEEVEE